MDNYRINNHVVLINEVEKNKSKDWIRGLKEDERSLKFC